MPSKIEEFMTKHEKYLQMRPETPQCLVLPDGYKISIEMDGDLKIEDSESIFYLTKEQAEKLRDYLVEWYGPGEVRTGRGEVMTEKVYCKGCKYVETRYLSGFDYFCRHPLNSKQISDSYHAMKTCENIHIANKNNCCPLREEAPPEQIVATETVPKKLNWFQRIFGRREK